MHSIGDIIKDKGGTVYSVASTDTIYDAIRLMAERKIGALLVIDDGELVGIISERDYSRKVVLRGLRPRDTPVSAVMSSPVVTISPDSSVNSGLRLMTEKYFRHLPVADDTGVIGMISIGDLVKAVIEDQQELIQQLESYLTH